MGLGKNRGKRPSFGRMSERDSYPIELYRSPTYSSWFNMKRRCLLNNRKETKNYGQRGISHNPSWRKFSSFLKDMGIRPDNKTLDRIDVNGNYCKENCRWATLSEQNINKRPGSNTGIKGITRHKKGHFLVRILPFKSKHSPTLELAKQTLKQMQGMRKLIKFKEGTMIPESFEIKRRVPREEYGFEEITLIIQFEENEDARGAILEAQNMVNEALGLENKITVITEDKEETKKEKKNGKANSTKDDNKNRKSSSEQDSGNDGESDKDHEASDPKASDDDNDSTESGEESAEGEDSEEKVPAKGKRGKASKEPKEEKSEKGKKSFRAKPQHYDRSIEAHKDIFKVSLESVAPDWKKNEESKRKAKKASENLEGDEFLDENGEVVPEFITKIRKLMK